jgi:hypothetical protein
MKIHNVAGGFHIGAGSSLPEAEGATRKKTVARHATMPTFSAAGGLRRKAIVASQLIEEGHEVMVFYRPSEGKKGPFRRTPALSEAIGWTPRD